MSTHPNAILMAVLKPGGTSRATMRNIMADEAAKNDRVVIGKMSYEGLVMESNYHDGFQIAADEGDLVFFDFVTYGYGETVEWAQLEMVKSELEAWAAAVSERYGCTYKIMVTANYW